MINPEVRKQIEREAYRLFERRGRQHGADWQDWLDAERMVRAPAEEQEGASLQAFTFRFRVNLGPGSRISGEQQSIVIATLPGGSQVTLEGNQPKIGDSTRLVLRGDGWSSEAEAESTGRQLADVFTLALVKNRIGIEIWQRRGGGTFLPSGLRMLEEGTQRRVLNDQLGLSVYPSFPKPLFASMGDVRSILGQSDDRIGETFRQVAAVRPELTDRERISIDLFNASFFEPASDTRLITLVMSIEALLELAPRPPEAVALVNSFMAQSRQSSLPKNEVASLVGTLRWLRKQSIRSAGRQLTASRLGANTYSGLSASDFFDHCYELRSTMVHGGDVRAAKEAAGTTAAVLEGFVSDLILARFLPGT